MDESAYMAQSFYADLFWEGHRDDPAWLDYAGYDLPPLPKYLIGTELRLEGYRRPTRADTRAWYANTSRRFGGDDALVAARRPMVLLGALGCVGIFWVGALAVDRRVGWLAAVLLMVNPLYRLHARRAMSDAPAECFILLAAALGLIAWREVARRPPTIRSWGAVLLAGLMIGLATLSKLNGVLGGLVLGAWALLGLVAPGMSGRSRGFLVLAPPLAGAVAFGVFVALDPYLTARPPRPYPPEIARDAALSFGQRVAAVYHHRADVSQEAMRIFPRDALPTLRDRAAVVLVQGFGRFGPLGPPGVRDSTIRFDWRQDRGAWVWLPLVLAGLLVGARRGWAAIRAGQAPLDWLIPIDFLVVAAVVTSFLPLAWDRYLMSIQPPATLLGATAVVAGIDRLRSLVARGAAPAAQPPGGPN